MNREPGLWGGGGAAGGGVCDVIPVGGYPCALPPGNNGQPGAKSEKLQPKG